MANSELIFFFVKLFRSLSPSLWIWQSKRRYYCKRDLFLVLHNVKHTFIPWFLISFLLRCIYDSSTESCLVIDFFGMRKREQRLRQ